MCSCFGVYKRNIKSAYSNLYEWHTNVALQDSYRTNYLTICNGRSKLKKGRNNATISGKKNFLLVKTNMPICVHYNDL